MKTSFMRPGLGRLRRPRQAAAPHRRRWRSAKASVFDADGTARRARDRHVQVPEGAAGGRPQDPAATTHPTRPRSTRHDDDQQADPPRLAPEGRADASTTSASVEAPRARRCATGQVLVRNHYLSLDPYMRGRMNDAQELRGAAAARRGDGRRHGRRGGRVEASELQARRQGRRHGRLAAVRGRRRRASRACCARSTRRTFRCRPISARSACPASPPGTG